MSWVAVAVGGAAVVSGAMASRSAGKAADAQSAAAAGSIDAQLQMYNQSRADVLPQIEAAKGATNALWGTPGVPATTTQGAPIYGYGEPSNPLAGMIQTPTGWVSQNDPTAGVMGTTFYNPQQIIGYQPGTTTPAIPGVQGLIQKGPGEFKESEGYQWTLGQGLQAQQRQASATGRLGSGAYIKDATKYAEGLASTEYDNFLRRYYQSLEPYFTMMTGGTRAASSLAGTGSNTANAMSALAQYSGNAQAAGNLGSAYPWTQLANQAAGSGSFQNALTKLFAPQTQPTPNPWGSAGALTYGW